MPVAPVSQLPYRRSVNTICAAAIGATLLAGIVASIVASSERQPRAKCRDHRRHTVELAPAAMSIVPAPSARTATCGDPVAGTWIADEYRPDQQDWIAHELRIHASGDAYRVAHTARLRDGDARGHARLDCMPDAIEFDTTGTATLDGDQLHVRGESLVARRARCTGELLPYDLDHFSGTVIGDTFDSVNNDGNTARDRPYRFRRVACE